MKLTLENDIGSTLFAFITPIHQPGHKVPIIYLPWTGYHKIVFPDFYNDNVAVSWFTTILRNS